MYNIYKLICLFSVCSLFISDDINAKKKNIKYRYKKKRFSSRTKVYKKLIRHTKSRNNKRVNYAKALKSFQSQYAISENIKSNVLLLETKINKIENELNVSNKKNKSELKNMADTVNKKNKTIENLVQFINSGAYVKNNKITLHSNGLLVAESEHNPINNKFVDCFTKLLKKDDKVCIMDCEDGYEITNLVNSIGTNGELIGFVCDDKNLENCKLTIALNSSLNQLSNKMNIFHNSYFDNINDKILNNNRNDFITFIKPNSEFKNSDNYDDSINLFVNLGYEFASLNPDNMKITKIQKEDVKNIKNECVLIAPANKIQEYTTINM